MGAIGVRLVTVLGKGEAVVISSIIRVICDLDHRQLITNNRSTDN